MADELPTGGTNPSAGPSGESAPRRATKSKPGLGERIKHMSSGALIGSAVGILVVGLIVGLGAGYKIEQNRTKNDVKNAKAEASKKPAAGGSTAANASVRYVGKVGATTPNEITLAGSSTGHKFLTSSGTVVVKATSGSPSDITTGARIVWKPVKGQSTQADEVIVLPADAKMGTSVISATPTTMEIKGTSGNVTVDTSKATVEKVTTAKLTDVAVGDKVVAQAQRVASTVTATEIIVLPSTSKFVE